MSGLNFIDVSDGPDQPISYPGMVAEFQKLGFSDVGRLTAKPTNDPTGEALVRNYAAEHQPDIRRSIATPTPVLSSPDSTSFVDVSWFWGFPSVRFLTVLEDGSLVETQRTWDHPPTAIEALASRTAAPVEDDMLAAHMPQRGRSIELVASNSPAELWEAHQMHVEHRCDTVGSRPRAHRSMKDALPIYQEVFDHGNSIATGSFLEGDGLSGLLLLAGVPLVSVVILADHPAVTITSAVLLLLWAGFLVMKRSRSEPPDVRPPFNMIQRDA